MQWENLDGVWQCGFTRDAEKVPYVDHAYAVPGCVDAEPGCFGRCGYASYKRTVVIGGPVVLTLTAGLHSTIYWDGCKIGHSDLGWTREEYRFDAGEEGPHELLVVCDNITSDKDLSELVWPNADFYVFAGIYDSVQIRRVISGEVTRVAVFPLSEITGEVRVKVEWEGVAPEQLFVSFDHAAPQAMPCTAEFTTKVPQFKVWSLEQPNMHSLTINGLTVRFGIRTVRCEGRHILLNGKSIKLIGYNRHDTHPQFGAAVPNAIVANDLLMIKRQGCNFLRGCHYPQREFILDMADELGLLVWDEGLSWGCSEEQVADPVFCDRNIEQVRKMVHRSINHPSVIMWGFLNEGAMHVEPAVDLVRRLNEACKEEDPTRLTVYASKTGTGDICHEYADVCSLNMYPGWYGDTQEPDAWEDICVFLRMFPEFFKDLNKPYLIGESGVAAIYGDHDGPEVRWSEEYQAAYVMNVLNEVLTHDEYVGLAIWQFCDARSYVWNPKHTQRPRGFNNKGVVNEYRQPKAAWNAVTERLKQLK